MDIGNRLRSVREEKNLSQGDIEERTGLLRCYISRVENGHTVPAIVTLEKMRVPWRCLCISSCMKVRSHLLYHRAAESGQMNGAVFERTLGF